ncbi:MAG: MFS transporter [Candidatus Accumulibacter phosphatis]|jgi:predicted MFS family arabinose efflux permease|uniref:MFS transporter n=1 Tax=Candidatus Accumulibacter contiguus TaxID=2954381 RepID=A0ABX1T5C0_9PROT|nr:MFS transporter [Candidatus Accumulibacter contiguus]NMQ04191.1 MFS transporter [Candidatus Accumulibacter contiguus]
MSDLARQQGRRRALALGIVIAAYVLSFFQRFAPAGIAPDLITAFNTTASSLGVLAATYFYVYTVMQVPTGILVDTLGPRLILLLGGLVGGVGSLLFGMAPNFDLALLGRTLIGLGVSVTFIAMLKIIALSFDERRFASLVGLSMLIGNLGSVLAGAPLSWLAQITGWRSIFVGLAAVSLLLGTACWYLLREPADESQSPSAPAGKPRFDRTVIFSGLLSVLGNRDTWPVAAVNFGISGSFFAFAGLWATPFLTEVHHLERAVAARHVSLYFAGFALGCVFVGTLSDRLGRRKPVLVAGSHLYALIWLVWLSGSTLPVSLSFALFALMGLLTASFTLTWACAKEVNPPLLSGMSTSVTNMGGFLAAAILQPLVGWVMDWSWQGGLTAAGARLYTPADFHTGLLLLAGTASFGALASWRIRETNCRNIWQAPA